LRYAAITSHATASTDREPAPGRIEGHDILMPSLTSVRAALTLTAAAAASAVVPAAHAATPGTQPAPLAPQSVGDSVQGLASAVPTQYVTGALGAGIAPVRDLRLDPLADTAVDPLDNALGTQVADFKPVSTAALTSPVTDGGSLGTLPLVGPLTALLPH
jgi:hypothetical protein